MARLDLDLSKLEIRPISAADETAGFSCGDEDDGDRDLNEFFRDDAFRLHELGVVRVYVARYEGKLVGYTAILADVIRLKTSEIKKLKMDYEDHPGIPALKVGRLAVQESFRQEFRGLGEAMMGFCYSIGVVIAGSAGCRLLTVDAYKKSVGFYEKLGFVRNKKKPEQEAPEADVAGSEDCVSMRFDLKSESLPAWCLGGP